MDELTQLQSYVRHIAESFSTNLAYLLDGTPAVPADHNPDEFPTEEIHQRAHSVFQVIQDAELLATKLPKFVSEQDQLAEIQRLNELNTAALARLNMAQEEAAAAQKLLHKAIDHVTKQHFATHSLSE